MAHVNYRIILFDTSFVGSDPVPPEAATLGLNEMISVAIIGDFDPDNPTHLATNRGIEHAAAALDVQLEAVWLATAEPHDLGRFQGFLCSPGSPYRSQEGALAAIRYARERNIPFIGTCGGFQHLILEYARNVLGVLDAAHAETDSTATRLFITRLRCSLVGKAMEVSLLPESQAASLYGASRSEENYYCNFGLNPQHRSDLEAAGLAVTGTDQDGEVRIMELRSHPFFLGTLFVPQARSAPGSPHPLMLGFCRAVTRPKGG
jgi:CTP synthase (UTP-ammonia lyase)